MVEDGMMTKIAGALLLALLVCGPSVQAASASGTVAVRAGKAGTFSDLSAQRRVRPARAPVRIRVTPLYRYPGPNAVRQCTSWLAQEARPSGTVIVPRMQCWWEPG
jgi:hypothetical protein